MLRNLWELLTMGNNDNEEDRVIDLASFKFKKLRKEKRDKYPDYLTFIIQWIEYDKAGNAFNKEIIYAPGDSEYTELSGMGKKVFIERCFRAIGEIVDTDPYFAVELEDRLKELYDLGGKVND